MTDETTAPTLADAIDTIEGGYEFMLAYAAQGRHTDRGAQSEQGPRRRLEAMASALAAVPGLARTALAGGGDGAASEAAAFLDALERDAAVSLAAIRLVLAAKDLSSQLVDNLNATIHLRALLTDLFLVDEALKRRS